MTIPAASNPAAANHSLRRYLCGVGFEFTFIRLVRQLPFRA
jgi:hypothetical protein